MTAGGAALGEVGANASRGVVPAIIVVPKRIIAAAKTIMLLRLNSFSGMRIYQKCCDWKGVVIKVKLAD